MAKKKKSVLPRATVLAYDKRQLAAFVMAVEKLGLIAEDIRLYVNQLPKPKPKTKPAVSLSPLPVPGMPSIPGLE